MMDPAKSISSEEEHTMENVSVEDGVSDVEKGNSANVDFAHGKDNNAMAKIGLSRRFVFAWAILTFALLVGFIGALSAALKKEDQVTTMTSSAQATLTEAIEDDNVTSLLEFLSFGDVAPPAFSTEILQGYSSKEEFEADLTTMAQYIVKSYIMWNVQNTNHYPGYNAIPLEGAVEDNNLMNETVATALAVASSASIASASSNKQAKASQGTETNNQEKTADEADLVKSDGNFIYLAYGDHLVVMTRSGRPVTKLYTNTTKPDEWGYVPMEYIRGLFITDNHVVVVTDSQGADVVYTSDGMSTMSFYMARTRVTAYTKPTASSKEMKKVKTSIVNGGYQDGRWMTASNSIQLVTQADVPAYSLTDPLGVQYFPWMSKADYVKEASALAEKEVIPSFVRTITDMLWANGEMPDMLRLNTWRPEGSPEPWDMPNYYGSFNEALQYFKQIVSISVDDFASGGEEMQVSTSAFFTPGYTTDIYGAEDSLVLPIAVSVYNETANFNLETVFLVHSKIVSEEGKVGTKFHSLKMLDGRIRSRFSLDVLGNDLRIATTIQKWNPLDNVWTTCGDQYYHEDQCITDDNWNSCFDVAINCHVGKVVKTGCPATFTCESEMTSVEEEMSSTDNFVIVYDIEQKGEMTERGRVRIGDPHEVITAVRFGENFSYAMTFDERDPFYVLELKAGQAPAIKGSVKMGGYARYLHPLNEEQTLLLGVGQNTTGTGLNQMNSGVLISIFDVSDPSKPKVVASQMLANPEELSSSSIAESDSKAIRYENGKLILPVSLYTAPVQMFPVDAAALTNASETSFQETLTPDFVFSMTSVPNPEDTFDGFVVYDVSKNGLKEAFRVNHFAQTAGKCYPCSMGVLAPRSFLYEDGTLVTVAGSQLVGTNVTTGVELWTVDPSVGADLSNPMDMCCY